MKEIEMPETSPAKKLKQKTPLDFPENYVVLDIETTGLSPVNNEIIELSAIKIVNGEITDEYSKLIKPSGYLSPFITGLTGITREMLKDAPHIKDSVLEFKEFCADNIIVGHNVSFDLKFINAKLQKYHNVSFDNSYIDTLTIARRFLPELKNKKLGTIATYFNLDTGGMHRGLKDCTVTNLCYCKFKELAGKKFDFS